MLRQNGVGADSHTLQVFLNGVNSRSFTLYIPPDVDTLAELCQFIAEEVPVFVPKSGGKGEYTIANVEDHSRSVYRFLYSLSGDPLWCVADCLAVGRIVASVNPGFMPPHSSLLDLSLNDERKKEISTPVSQFKRNFSHSTPPGLSSSTPAAGGHSLPTSPSRESNNRMQSHGKTAKRPSSTPVSLGPRRARSFSPSPIPPLSSTPVAVPPQETKKGYTKGESSAPIDSTTAQTPLASIHARRNDVEFTAPTKGDDEKRREPQREKGTLTPISGELRGTLARTSEMNGALYDWSLTSCELFVIRKWKSFQMVRQQQTASPLIVSPSCSLLGIVEVRHQIHHLIQQRVAAAVADPVPASTATIPAGSDVSPSPPLRVVISGPQGSGKSTLGAMLFYELLHSSSPFLLNPRDGIEAGKLNDNGSSTSKGNTVVSSSKGEEVSMSALEGYLVVLLDLPFLVEQALEEFSTRCTSTSFSASKNQSDGSPPQVDDIVSNLLFWCEAVLYAVVDSAVACRRPRGGGLKGRKAKPHPLSAACIAEFFMSLLYPMSCSRDPSQLRAEVEEMVGDEVVSDWEEFAQFAGVLFREAFSACTAAGLSGHGSSKSGKLNHSSSVASSTINSGGGGGPAANLSEVISLRDDALQLIFRDLAVEIAHSFGFVGIFFVIDGVEILLRGAFSPSVSRPLGDLAPVLNALCDAQQTPYIHVLLIINEHESPASPPPLLSHIPGLPKWVNTLGFLGPDSPTVADHLPKHIHCFDEIFPIDMFLGAPGYLAFLQQLCLCDPKSGIIHVPSCIQLNYSMVQKSLRKLQKKLVSSKF